MTTITLNHDVPTVGQPTEETPDVYSLVDTTEKVVEEQVVDKSLLTSQRIIDSRPASIDPWDANIPLRDGNREWGWTSLLVRYNLQDIGSGFDADVLYPIPTPISDLQPLNPFAVLNHHT